MAVSFTLTTNGDWDFRHPTEETEREIEDSRRRVRVRSGHRRSLDLVGADAWIRDHVGPVGGIETEHERPWATRLARAARRRRGLVQGVRAGAGIRAARIVLRRAIVQTF
jgi:hypothetical protein